jgi:hypothetical protein
MNSIEERLTSNETTDFNLQAKHQGVRNVQNMTPNEAKTEFALK